MWTEKRMSTQGIYFSKVSNELAASQFTVWRWTCNGNFSSQEAKEWTLEEVWRLGALGE